MIIPGMVGEVFVPNSKSVVHFILVDFGKVGLEFDIKKNLKEFWSKKNFIGHKKFLDPKKIWFNKILSQKIF